MAIVERGKGKNKQTIEIVRSGTLLRRTETEMGDERLPGYRRFVNIEAARAALAAEVRGLLKDGMKPADEDAAAIAAQVAPAKPGKPTLPLRRDLGIYNEATGFVVTSRRMAGKELEEGSAEWKKAVNRGDLLPLTLMQDDPFVIRVVVGGPLTQQEADEWVARVDWHLNISDGQLCVTGGAPFSNGDYEEMESYNEQFVGEVAIPKGRYKAALYSMLHGVNGGGVMDHLAGGYNKGESLEDWFVRTRPGQQPPDWEADGAKEVVGFLLHLEPIDAAPKNGLSELPEDGWFAMAENARKPELCPLGLQASDVQRRADAESGEWTYVRDVSALLGNSEPVSLQGGSSVALPARSLAAAARLGWLGSRFTAHELRVTLPKGAAMNLAGKWPAGVVAVEEAGAVRILLSPDLDPGQDIAALAGVAARIAALPDDTVLDARSAPVDVFPGMAPEAGKLILRGTVSGGVWEIARAFPAITAEKLTAELRLARELNEGASITVKNAAEARAIVEAAKKSVGEHLQANPPVVDGASIKFKQPGHEVALVGITVYKQLFGGPATEAEAEDTGDDLDEDDDGMFPTEPIQGALLYSTPRGRAFHQTMALLISAGVADAVKQQEKELKKAGFKELGDVMCAEFDQIGFHGYSRADKTSVAWFRCAFPDEATCEILTLFDGGQLLLTSANSNIKDSEKRGVHVQDMMGSTPAELWAAHEARLPAAKAKLGAPLEMPTSLQGFAEALAVLLDKD